MIILKSYGVITLELNDDFDGVIWIMVQQEMMTYLRLATLRLASVNLSVSSQLTEEPLDYNCESHYLLAAPTGS